MPSLNFEQAEFELPVAHPGEGDQLAASKLDPVLRGAEGSGWKRQVSGGVSM